MALPRINGTTSPSGAPDYDRLFAGRLCTIALAVGFDESGANRSQDRKLVEGLAARGFARDDAGALRRIAEAGRPAPTRSAAHYVAHAVARDGVGHSVDAVVTTILGGDGSAGSDNASLFLEALDRCDVAAYGGHGRYGTGPDFDYNFTADLLDAEGRVEASFAAYKDLEEELAERGRPHGHSATREYLHLKKSGRLVIRRVNGGNLVVNLRNYHAGEFGANVMVDQLKGDPHIRRFSKQKFSRRYRLWLLSGCRTNDYFYNLRKINPTANAGGLELFGTRRTLYWSATAATLLAFLDGVLARSSHQALLDGMAAQNPPGEPGAGASHVAHPRP